MQSIWIILISNSHEYFRFRIQNQRERLKFWKSIYIAKCFYALSGKFSFYFSNQTDYLDLTLPLKKRKSWDRIYRTVLGQKTLQPESIRRLKKKFYIWEFAEFLQRWPSSAFSPCWRIVVSDKCDFSHHADGIWVVSTVRRHLLTVKRERPAFTHIQWMKRKEWEGPARGNTCLLRYSHWYLCVD